MHQVYNEFLVYLEEEDRGKSLKYVLDMLSKGEIGIVALYQDILAKSLNEMECSGPEELCIFKEHVRSSIVRTIIENCYSYVIREKKKNFGDLKGEKVVVLCPPEELHEIGPRMVADFFTLSGFDVTFVGANTPKKSFISAISILKPKYVAIGISSYYNLLAAKRTVAEVRKVISKDTVIIAGGGAFLDNPSAYREIGADMLLSKFDDIKKLAGGD